jgi:hypothetical protein
MPAGRGLPLPRHLREAIPQIFHIALESGRRNTQIVEEALQGDRGPFPEQLLDAIETFRSIHNFPAILWF